MFSFFTVVEKTNESHCCSNKFSQQVFFFSVECQPPFLFKKKMLDDGSEEEIFVVFAGFWKIKTFKEKKQSGCKMRFVCFFESLSFSTKQTTKACLQAKGKTLKTTMCFSFFKSHHGNKKSITLVGKTC